VKFVKRYALPHKGSPKAKRSPSEAWVETFEFSHKIDLTNMPTVALTPYTPEWPTHFQAIREELLSVFAPMVITIEHIGSTSVPGLSAKPVIDVLLGAHSLADIESKIKPLSEIGYSYVPKYECEIPMRRYFVKSSTTSLRVHLHAVELNSRFWQEHLAFRDRLRADANLCVQYQSLKLRLAKEFANDKPAYTAAKGPFIQAVLAVQNKQ
jgi:GrpB-like predicted nucleotidyltransferase (UPF0157 family)